MKIANIYIKSFGKLKNVKIDFDDSLNILQQSNGYGKTTLASFIRAMLYGFKYNRYKRGKESVTDVGVWTTWNSRDKIGGSMVVQHNGELYRIERYFGLTAKQETLTVVKQSSGTPITVETSLGEFFLGLSAESFDRSTYFPQEAVEIVSNENFDTRLAGLVQNVENFDKVSDSLRRYKKELKYERGNGGEIYQLEMQKLTLQRQLNQCNEAEIRQKQIDKRLQDIAVEREEIAKTKANCSENISALQKDIAHLQLSKQNSDNEKLQQLEEKLHRVGEIEQDFAKCCEIQEQVEKLPEEARTQRQLCIPLLVVGIVLILAGIAVCFVRQILGVILAVCGIPCAILAFFIKPSVKTLQAGEKDAYISQYFNIANKYVCCGGLSYAEVQKAMWQFYNQYTGDKREFEALSRKVVVPVGDIEEKKRSLQAEENKVALLQQKLLQLSREEGQLAVERAGLDTDGISVREKLLQTEQQLVEANQKYAVATKVSQLLEQAGENLSVSYLPALCKRCGQLLSQITQHNYEIALDRTFSLSLREGDVTKPLDNFSRGLREITLLCFRVALSEMLFDGNIPFIVIDDAFVNFDEQNFLRATMLLKQMSQQTQVLYFTCHDRLGALK